VGVLLKNKIVETRFEDVTIRDDIRSVFTLSPSPVRWPIAISLAALAPSVTPSRRFNERTIERQRFALGFDRQSRLI